MGIPLLQKAVVGAYVVRQHVMGRKRYPLVLMLEPLFRCNLACSGCGKIDYPDKSVCQTGTYDRAVAAIKAAKARGFRVNINCTLFNNVNDEQAANFFDSVKEMGVDAMTISPGYAYERAPDQQHFLNRGRTKEL